MVAARRRSPSCVVGRSRWSRSRRVDWPAFNSSNQLHALTTVGQFVCLVGLFAAGWLWRRGRRRGSPRLASVVFLSAFVVVTLGMPLGATKLYLFGISVDQQFRTEYLTRLTDIPGPARHDLRRPAAVLSAGLVLARRAGRRADRDPGWEMFKPWAITSIAVAVVLAFVLWSAMIRFEYALVVTTATAAVTLAYASTEPYAAMITVLLPPVLVLAWSGCGAGASRALDAMSGATREVGRGWAAVVGVGLFLGLAATVLHAAARATPRSPSR